MIYSINITCMMVLASVYLSVSASLPSTANIKPVEIWLLFNLTWPFLIIVANIIIQVTERRFLTIFDVFFLLLEVLEKESSEDNDEDMRRGTRKMTVEPIDEEKMKSEKKENIFINTNENDYIKQILIYSVKFFYPFFYVMFLIGYFLYYLLCQ